jgi:hypothetical protein
VAAQQPLTALSFHKVRFLLTTAIFCCPCRVCSNPAALAPAVAATHEIQVASLLYHLSETLLTMKQVSHDLQLPI